jgi:hypothetical protein
MSLSLVQDPCIGLAQRPFSGTEIILIGLVVGVVVVLSATWSLVQHFHAIAHEGMHALVGSLAGGKVRSIELDSAGEGETIVERLAGPRAVAFVFSGYLGSSAFGLGAARLIQFGHGIVVLWAAVGLLGLLLLVLKRSFGFITVPLAGYVIFLVLKHTSAAAQTTAAYSITWFLLLSGVRMIAQHGLNARDARILKDRTSIPRLIWVLLWLAGTLAAVAIGARWMLHPAVR